VHAILRTFASSISGAPFSPIVHAKALDLSTLLPLMVPIRSASFSQDSSTTMTGQGKPSLELLVEIALYCHVSTDYLLLGRELDRDSVRVSLLELSAQMMELAKKL
jgi:hypothetical protein